MTTLDVQYVDGRPCFFKIDGKEVSKEEAERMCERLGGKQVNKNLWDLEDWANDLDEDNPAVGLLDWACSEIRRLELTAVYLRELAAAVERPNFIADEELRPLLQKCMDALEGLIFTLAYD